VEVRPERAGDLVGEEPADRAACYPPHDLTNQMAKASGVVARGAARLPPRGLRGQERRRPVPVVDLVVFERPLPAGYARCVRQQMTNLDIRLAVGCELRPISGDRRIHVNSPRSTSTSAASAVIVLVTDQVAVTVSFTHGVPCSMSTHPPHRSTRKRIPNDGYRGTQFFPGVEVLLKQITER
jgi:hypothetical protein